MNKEQAKQISKEWHEAFGTAALKDNYDKYLHTDFKADFFGGQQLGKEEYAIQDQQFAKALHPNKITVIEQVAEDDKVISLMTWEATQVRDLPGIPNSGKSFKVKGFAIDYFKDEKVVKHFPLFDQFEMMGQLGVLPDGVVKHGQIEQS
ncbi:ester cyclase [Chitinophaga sp. 22321]|uniref:Ester cyclase n=1 Tax=Chitinophaga hostae TaxID=2831022 RepID=A0ABS5IYZ9_9BACT|nr:ester cyclase [Chitinophaga hostae]MBS0028011.1 ester cyclase [Chitinophaga hostae]